MNFPLDNPIFQLFYWLVDTAGIGGVGVGLIVLISIGAYAGALRWITRATQTNEPQEYAYPTPALLEHT